MGENEEIEIREGAGGKSAYVGASRVRVSDIARMYQVALDELVVERIQKGLPHLTVRQVVVAIKYWRAHKKEIEDEIAEEEAIFNSLPSKI
jgi:uncharacterized protein (DUF433 family)